MCNQNKGQEPPRNSQAPSYPQPQQGHPSPQCPPPSASQVRTLSPKPQYLTWRFQDTLVSSEAVGKVVYFRENLVKDVICARLTGVSVSNQIFEFETLDRPLNVRLSRSAASLEWISPTPEVYHNNLMRRFQCCTIEDERWWIKEILGNGKLFVVNLIGESQEVYIEDVEIIGLASGSNVSRSSGRVKWVDRSHLVHVPPNEIGRILDRLVLTRAERQRLVRDYQAVTKKELK